MTEETTKKMTEKVIDLSTIANYKHTESVASAILDEDFKTKHSRVIASALRIGDKRKHQKMLQSIQKNMSKKELNRIACAMDYYGYMYDRTDNLSLIKKERATTKENREMTKKKILTKFKYPPKQKKTRKNAGFLFPTEQKKRFPFLYL